MADNYLSLVVADVTGDTFLYAVGRFGRRSLKKRLGGLTEERLEKVKRRVDEHPAAFLITGKASHGIGGPILVAAGAIKMPLQQFLGINLAATAIKSIFLLGLGYYFSGSNLPFESYLRYLALISVVVLLFFGWKYGKRQVAYR